MRRGGDLPQAIEHYDNAIEMNPELFDALYGRGRTYYSMGRYQSAVDDLYRAIELRPDDAAALNLLAWTLAYNMERDLRVALEQSTRAVEIDPDPNYRDTLGLVHLRLGNYELALEQYDLALSVNPSLEISYWGRGQAHEALGNLNEATVDYEMYLSLDPNGDHAEEVRQWLDRLR